MILFLLLILLLPLQQYVWVLFSIGPLTSPQLLGAACVLYAIGYMAFGNRVPDYLGTWIARWYLLLTALIVVSYLTAGLVSPGVNPALSAISMLMLWFTTLAVVDTLPRLRWVLLATVASVGWASTYVIREVIKGRAWDTGIRVTGWVVGDGNIFGVCLALVLPLAWYMSQEERPRWERMLCLGSMGLMLLATIGSGSRGGFLGVAAGGLVIVWRSRRRARNLAIALVLITVFNVVYPTSPLRRLLWPTQTDEDSAGFRLVQWNAALRIMRDHPFFGIGLGRFKSEMLKYAPPDYNGPAYVVHNSFLSIAAEVGTPAALAFFAMLLAVLRDLGRIRKARTAPDLVRQAATGLSAGVIGGMVAVFFVSPFELRMLWFIVFLSMTLVAFARQAASGKIAETVAQAAGADAAWRPQGTPASPA